MKSLLLLILLTTLSISLQSQVTISGKFVSHNGDYLAETHSESGTGYEVGLGYWFRLKNKRIEFTPEIGFTNIDSELRGATNNREDVLLEGFSGFSINSNVLIYPLDFHSDCNVCPTFSKEGGLIKKGFHCVINPAYYRKSYQYGPLIDLAEEPVINDLRLNLGAGLDIGVTNILTLVPHITYGFSIIKNEVSFGDPLESSRQLQAGLRAIFRFDKDKW